LFVVLLVIAPPSQELEPPTNPARFKLANAKVHNEERNQGNWRNSTKEIDDWLEHPAECWIPRQNNSRWHGQ
jgi:hypothetical protein